MSAHTHYQNDGASGNGPGSSNDAVPPTVAAFSPNTISGNSLTSKQRSTIIVHRKSPLLVATPPAVTRALAYSHPFLLPLNRLVGLLSWTTGDPWESFLLLVVFWAVTLHGGAIVLWGGPILVVIGLMLGLYSRRYSPLSSTGLTGEKHGHKKELSESKARQHKTLDEIVETLREFTTRCNILLEPMRDLTDFLSTQRTATSTTTRPALTALLTRIIFVTPLWILLTLPPFYLITMRRVVITVGTIILTWHSKPARIFRVLLWRSLLVRRASSVITGLQFSAEVSAEATSEKSPGKTPLLSLPSFRSKQPNHRATDFSTKRRRANSSGIRFTFILYENQRRWLGIGWTYSLFAYERPAWSDEHLNPVPPTDEFELPEVQGGNARWRWVAGSEWRIDGLSSTESGKKKGKSNKSSDPDDNGWIYYDNKWNDARRQDGWGRYTRRRKWCRDAELVEMTPSTEATPPPSPSPERTDRVNNGKSNSDDGSLNSNPDKDSAKLRRRRWFGSTDIKSLPSSSPPTSDPLSSSGPAKATGAVAVTVPGAGTGAGAGTADPEGQAGSNNNAGLLGSSPLSIPSISSSLKSNSLNSRRASQAHSSNNTDGDRESLSLSIREKEIEEAENTVDKWGSQPGNAAERAGRAWGLGDDAHMSLS
ncbi:peroxisome- protein [Myotisia sp. PD_48]|nr:peroxisome- protein [Myotisia sp. PD_48]